MLLIFTKKWFQTFTLYAIRQKNGENMFAQKLPLEALKVIKMLVKLTPKRVVWIKMCYKRMTDNAT